LRVSSVGLCALKGIFFYKGKLHRLFRFDIAAALLFASAFELAPHAFKDSANRVGSPFGFSIGPGILPMRARKLARRGLSPALTGGFNVPPVSA
jgi:hypothetical protein